jgi:HAD superfamily hydrolase (TIGR01549 family)
MLKAILFDMDGVLVDSKSAWFSVFNGALKDLEGKEISEEDFNTYVWAKEFNEIRPQYFSVPKEKVQEYFGNSHQVFLDSIRPFEQTKGTLSDLKKKYMLIVVTNTYTDRAESMLEKLSLRDLFDHIYGADKVKRAKPEPDLLLKVMEDLKLSKGEVVFIGDTVWDKIASEKAGVEFIGFQLDTEKTIEKIEELPYLLESD